MIYCIVTACLLERDWEVRKQQYQLGIFSLVESLRPYIFPESGEPRVKVIIVENQLATVMDTPRSFLDDFGVPVMYTKTNALDINNKGTKEWEDIQTCIDRFQIQDDDFIVKMTGRYIHILETSVFEAPGRTTFQRDMTKLIQKYNTVNPLTPLDNFFGGVIERYEAFYHYKIMFEPSFLQFLVKQVLETDNPPVDCMIRYGSYNDPAINYRTEDCVTGVIGMRCKYVKMIPRPAENECVEHLWARVSLTIPESRVKMFEKLGTYICPACNAYFLV